LRLALLIMATAGCSFDPSPVGGSTPDGLADPPDARVDGVLLSFDAGQVDASPDAAPAFDAPIVFVPCAIADAPTGYVTPVGSTSCYRFFDDTVTWLQAENDCEAEGGLTHLAVITSPDEVTAIRLLAGDDIIWIGLTDRVTEGEFLWVTNTPTIYTYWGSGEPNDAGGEDCGEMTAAGTWNDHECASATPRRYVCETDSLLADNNRY